MAMRQKCNICGEHKNCDENGDCFDCLGDELWLEDEEQEEDSEDSEEDEVE